MMWACGGMVECVGLSHLQQRLKLISYKVFLLLPVYGGTGGASPEVFFPALRGYQTKIMHARVQVIRVQGPVVHNVWTYHVINPTIKVV